MSSPGATAPDGLRLGQWIGRSWWLLVLPVTVDCAASQQPAHEERLALASEIETELLTELDAWYPRVIDAEHGGFLTAFTYAWEPTDSQDKMIVTQSRHLWTLSTVGAAYPDRTDYARLAGHGFEFLRDNMWDDEFGGFFQTVTRAGEPVLNRQGELQKTLYGNAFAIYGLAAYYDFSDDPAALQLAQQAFAWLETHAHDPVGGGYFQPLARDGTPTKTGYPKDYNSGIHILEALAELYTAWPDDQVRERLTEMFHIIRDTVTTDGGYLNLYFDASWSHVSYRDSSDAVIRENIGRDHVSPGHDIETAYLLLEAADVMGIGDDTTTHGIAKRLTDHTLEAGWDAEAGGVYDVGYYFAGDDSLTIVADTKEWWGQAEAMHTLAIMANLYPDDPHDYFQRFREQWDYIKTNLIDPEHGGWFTSGLDKDPDSRTSKKSQIWKGNYHTVRSLLGSLGRLQ